MTCFGVCLHVARRSESCAAVFGEAPHKKALTIHFFSVMMRPSNRRTGRVLRKTHPFREPPVGARRRETGGGMALRGQTERGRSPSVWATGLATRYQYAAVCWHGQSGRVCAKPGGTAGALLLSLHFAEARAFVLPLTLSKRSDPHVRKQHSLQNLSE